MSPGKRSDVNNFRNLALWIIIALLLVALFNLFQGPAQRQGRAPISFSEFNQQVVGDQIKTVNIAGTHVEGQFKNGTQFATDIPDDPSLTSRLLEHNVDIKVRPEGDNITLLSVFINWFPMLLFVAVMIFLMRQMQAGSGKTMGFGKSRAQELSQPAEPPKVEDGSVADSAH